MPRILVTGSRGFLGRHFFRASAALAPQLELEAWVRARDGDLLVMGNFERALDRVMPDAVLHLAWGHLQSASYDFDPGHFRWAEASETVLAASQAAGVRCFLVGSQVDDEPSASVWKASPYSKAKQLLRQVATPLVDSGEATWIRPGTVMSIADHKPRVVSRFLSAISQEDLPLHDAHAMHDFICVEDVASGMVMSLEHRLVGWIELGYGRLTSVCRVLRSIDTPRAERLVDCRLPDDHPFHFCGGPVVSEPLTATGWVPHRTQWLLGHKRSSEGLAT
jgi:nucleoside-diphosphate-sugar epimerase